MTPERRAVWRERVELGGDAALITSAVLAVLTSIVLLVSAGVGDREVPVPLQIAAAVLSLLGGIAGPVIAWAMHRRRVSVPAGVGAALGGPVAGALFWAFVGLSSLIDLVASPFTDFEYVGPLTAVALLAAGFVALFVWLVADAVRDLAPTRREHRPIDLVRMLSATVVAGYAAVILALAFGSVGGELAEALAFMLMGAVSGASMVTIADLATRLVEPRPAPAPEAPA